MLAATFHTATGFLLLGAFAFVGVSAVLTRLERPDRGILPTHLRSCALVYGALAGLAYLLFTTDASPESLEYASYVLLLPVPAYAILLNAATVLAMRRFFRLGRRNG